MKAPGERALELPWLPPSAAALAALTRAPSAALWGQVRHDPGCLALLTRSEHAAHSFPSSLGSLALLEAAQQSLQRNPAPLINWRRPGAERVVTLAQRQAWLASELATRVSGCLPEHAWTAGLLAPLGWFAVAALDASVLDDSLHRLDSVPDTGPWQRETWGLDHTALARRLGRNWRLPPWLVSVIGHLGLHVRIAERLGAEPQLFQIVQLAIGLLQERDRGLGLSVGAAADELTSSLGLAMPEADALAERAVQVPVELPEVEGGWTAPVLGELLRLAVEQRRQEETLRRLQTEVDQLQQALEHQCHDEKDRLQTLKLAAVAELAAGAGHEINNPLAVISGQAQYLLKQLALAEEQLIEDPSPTLYVDSLKSKLHKSLTTIVGQTQRIHVVLTDLMQFARPSQPRKQPIALETLLQDAIAALQGTADAKNVRLTCAELPAELVVKGDALQWRTVVGNVLRNAVEAAPCEGWARIRCDRIGADVAEISVEDNGPGPATVVREHLFDPFFSGRSAGRGRGLGLSTAWRLARQNGGDVRFAGIVSDVTRFVLQLPLASALESALRNSPPTRVAG
jgi:signal transduction histidine kinase